MKWPAYNAGGTLSVEAGGDGEEVGIDLEYCASTSLVYHVTNLEKKVSINCREYVMQRDCQKINWCLHQEEFRNAPLILAKPCRVIVKNESLLDIFIGLLYSLQVTQRYLNTC